MEKYYKKRLETLRRVSSNLASTMEVNEILEIMKVEARNVVPSAPIPLQDLWPTWLPAWPILQKGGDILIGNETKLLIEDMWPTFDLGLVRLKGIEKPVEVFSLKKDQS